MASFNLYVVAQNNTGGDIRDFDLTVTIGTNPHKVISEPAVAKGASTPSAGFGGEIGPSCKWAVSFKDAEGKTLSGSTDIQPVAGDDFKTVHVDVKSGDFTVKMPNGEESNGSLS